MSQGNHGPSAGQLELGKGDMPTASLDILRRHEDGSLLWVEAAHDIEAAKARLQELCAQTPGNYFVFDQKSQQIVAKFSSEEGGD
jgi:hypothetical protein